MTQSGRWTEQPEAGSPRLMRLMARLALAAGRPVTRALLWPIAIYFWLAMPRARRASRDYLQRALPRRPGARDGIRHFHAFASVLLDRIYLLAGRTQLFDIALHGVPALDQALAHGRGVVLVGAHFGSFECLRALGRQQPGMRITLAMYERNAQRIGQLLRSIDPALQVDVVALGRVDSMLELQQRLDDGHCVGFLADRSFSDDPTLTVPFLGTPAAFPTGVFRIAAALRRPVLMMAGVYGGGKRYQVRLEPLADFTASTRAQRTAAVDGAVREFAVRLEGHCREAPYNWFNFYDFWARRSDDDQAKRSP
ncbi:MAG: acyl-CoA synthetase [Burkholderiaceae bacterium]